jgi:hypothetical protein
MAHTLTETPVFTPTITVPDPLDSGTTRAQDVAAIAQGLANRTQHAKAVTDVAAVKNAPNTFTALQTFNNGITTTTANITQGAAVGTNLNVGGLLTVNGGIQASDLSLELKGDVSVAGRLNANGGIGAAGAPGGVLAIEAPIAFNQAMQVNAPHLYLGAGVDVSHGSVAANQPQRLVHVDISRARISGDGTSAKPYWSSAEGYWDNIFSTAPAVLEIPIIIPRGTLQWSYQVIWGGTGNTAQVAKIVRDYSTAAVQAVSGAVAVGSLLTQSTPTSDTPIGGGVFLRNGIMNAGPVITEPNDPSVARWVVLVTLQNLSYCRLFGLRLQFWDPGPRNG